jgi:hypothetical protein
MNVRIADSSSGNDGPHIDRMISSIKDSESQTRILIGDVVDVSTTATEIFGTYGFDQIFNSDDFISMIQQFNLFRIKAIKFDISDVNPQVATINQWGIWHDNYETTVPAYSRSNVADLPDSRVISVGTGQTTLYWVAHGTAENQFQAGSTAGSPSQRFGGLKYYLGLNSGTSIKYSVTVHAIVDFRGRR